MKVLDKLLWRRFSKDDYKQLYNLLSEESLALMRRAQYVIGAIIVAGLMVYFMAKGLGPVMVVRHWAARIGAMCGGTIAAIIILWALWKRWKTGGSHLWRSVIFMSGFSVWMGLFILLSGFQEPGKVKWEYVIYFVATLVGWQCSCGAVKEHLCEKILLWRKGEEGSQ